MTSADVNAGDEPQSIGLSTIHCFMASPRRSIVLGFMALSMSALTHLEAADFHALAVAACDNYKWNGNDLTDKMRQGETYYVDYQWEASSLPSSAEFTHRLYLDGNPCDSASYSVLLPGNIRPKWNSFYSFVAPSAGRHTLQVILDAHNDVSESDEGNNSVSRSFTVLGPPPPPSAPYDPVGTVSNIRPEFNWAPAAGVSWYYLHINRNGAKYYAKWVEGTNWSPSFDFPSGTYEWWVQTWSSDGGTGPWSIKADFSLPPYQPGALNPLGPAGTVPGTRSPQFVWTAADRATWYQLWLSKDQQTYLTKWVSADTTWMATNLPVGNFRWWVRGWNTDGYGPWSTNADFSIALVLPSMSDPVAPTGTVTGVRRPQFSWTASTDATWYYLWMSKAGVKYYEKWVQGTNTWTPTWDMPADSYAWWVRPWNPDGNGPWSARADLVLSP